MLAVLLIGLCQATTAARGGPPKQAYTLKQCIAIALRYNPVLLSSNIAVEIAQKGIAEADGLYDPYLQINLTGGQDILPAISLFNAGQSLSVSNSFQGNLSLTKRFTTGTELSLAFLNGRSDSNSLLYTQNPAYHAASLGIVLTQNILKGFGLEVNRAPMNTARANYSTERIKKALKISEIVMTLSRHYWQLYHAHRDLVIKNQALKLAHDQLKIVDAKIEAGRMVQIDRLGVLQSIAVREEAVIIAKNSILDKENELRKVMGLPLRGSKANLSQLIPKDRPLKLRPKPDVAREIDSAKHHNIELLAAREGLKLSRLAILTARDKNKPSLNAVFSTTWTGMSSSPKTTYWDLLRGRAGSWSAGLVFTYPLGNKSAKNAYIKRKLELRRANLEISILQREIVAKVEAAVRAIEMNRKRIHVTKLSARLAREKLKAEQIKFGLGKRTTQDVLLFQEDLKKANVAQVRALVDYLTAVTTLDHLTGSLLAHHNIKWR